MAALGIIVFVVLAFLLFGLDRKRDEVEKEQPLPEPAQAVVSAGTHGCSWLIWILITLALAALVGLPVVAALEALEAAL